MQQVVKIPKVKDRLGHPLSLKYGYPIGSWCTVSVTRFDLVFANQIAFNEPLRSWRTSMATSMIGMFDGAQAFEQSLVRIRTRDVREEINRCNRYLILWNVWLLAGAL
jgi:Mycoplasma protein of unknown function, DUF285